MPTPTIRIMCPNLTCRKVLAVPSSARGKTVRCRGCGISIRIPEQVEEPVETDDVDVMEENPKKSKSKSKS